MADRYTSRISLKLSEPLPDVGELVRDAGKAKDLDRASPVADQGRVAQEVHWGGRMQKAVVRQLEEDDGTALLRTETYIGTDGITTGLQRQAKLLQGLSRHVRGREGSRTGRIAITGVYDHAAMTERDEAWMNRVAVGSISRADAIVTRVDAQGTLWVRTHGAARFDIPDLELYGLKQAQVPAGEAALEHVHEQLLDGGLGADLTLPDGTPIYLLPVRDAWQQLPLDWPGIGRAGQNRGEGLDGPRASLSVRHKPRFGRYKKDLQGVIDRLEATT